MTHEHAGDRRQRIVRRLVGAADELESSRICTAAADVVAVTGAGVMLMSGDVQRGSLCSSNRVSALIEELQFAVGEGPCIDAYELDLPVSEPNLREPAVVRWLAFREPVLAAGARAVFGFPLQVGAVRLGALNLYNDAAGELTSEQHADALVMADVAAQAILVLQADAPPGVLATELEAGADFQYIVHQASGMVSAQLNITVAQALIRLRAHAFGNDRALHDVALAVVNRALRFDDATGEKDPAPGS